MGFGQDFLENLRPSRLKNHGYHHFRRFFSDDENQQFAVAFFLACFATACYPLLSAWRIAFDTNVTFWLGWFPFWLTLPIPFIFIGVYILHSRAMRPKRTYMMFSVIVPGVLFFMTGVGLSSRSAHLQDRLTSVDCQVIPRFREVFAAAEAARARYKECNPNGEMKLFQTCPDYKKWQTEVKNREDIWAYLQFLETNYYCTGFCKTGDGPLWNYRMPETERRYEVRDACAPCVASVFRAKIDHAASQLMFYSAFAILVGLSCMFVFKENLRQLGLRSKQRRSLLGQLAATTPAGMPRPYGAVGGVPYPGAPPMFMPPAAPPPMVLVPAAPAPMMPPVGPRLPPPTEEET